MKAGHLRFSMFAAVALFVLAGCGSLQPQGGSQGGDRGGSPAPQDGTSPEGPGVGAQQRTEDGVTVIEMTAGDYAFKPAFFGVRPGQKVRLTLANKGLIPHNIVFEFPGSEVAFAKALNPGERKTLEFAAPEKEGTYVYYCPVGNHQELGMEGKIVVGDK